MDLKEGVGESDSPARSFTGGHSQQGVRDEVYARLLEKKNEEAINNPDFRQVLDVHFNRLPASYELDIKMDKVEGVVLHQKLLAQARDPENCPVFHIRFLENFGTKRKEIDDQEVSSFHDSREVSQVPVHEVVFSTTDEPKLLSQLSALLSDIGLNIREAHVFSTTDGYSLDVFVVDGWPVEDTEGLSEEMRKAIARHKNNWPGSPHYESAPEKGLSAETKSVEWEIDLRLVKLGEKIGSGSKADLHLGHYLGQVVAVKIVRAEELDDRDSKAVVEFAQEVSILRKYQHQNVVHFIGACTKSPNFWIVTEYMSGGSLHEYLKKNRHVELPRLLKFAIDTCKGMEYMHQNNIIHRDLKAANLLINTANVVKVADFGISRSLPEVGTMTAEVGSYMWMAPEIINHQPYGLKADIYSFGIVLWELVTAKVPYEGMSPVQAAVGVMMVRKLIQGRRPEIPCNVNPKLLDLMQICWATNPDDRPSFSETRVELEQLLKEIKGN